MRSTIGHEQMKFTRNHELTNQPTIEVVQIVNTEHIASRANAQTQSHSHSNSYTGHMSSQNIRYVRK